MSQSEERDNLSVMDAGSRLRLMSGTVLKKPRWERQKSIKKRDGAQNQSSFSSFQVLPMKSMAYWNLKKLD